MKKILKAIGLFLCLLFFITILILAVSGRWRFPYAVSGYFSKEVCSCLFVVQQTKDYCVNYHHQVIAPHRFLIDEEQKTVHSSWFIFSGSAQFMNPETGCLLKKN
jgi:hypothetical protein